jgi:hypothetical protein
MDGTADAVVKGSNVMTNVTVGGLSQGGNVTAKVTGSNITSLDTSWEPALGNPASNGYVLSSTTDGTRSWVAQSSGGSMVWPSGGSGIPYYSGSSSWGTTLSTGMNASQLPQLDSNAKFPGTVETAIQQSSEKVTGFATSGNWTLGTNWTFVTDHLQASSSPASPGSTYTAFTPTIGVKYRISVTVTNYSGSGAILFSLGGVNSSSYTGNGTYTEDITATTTGQLVLGGSAAGFTGYVPSVSITEVQSGNIVSNVSLGAGRSPTAPLDVYSRTVNGGATAKFTLDGPVAANSLYLTNYVNSAAAGNSVLMQMSRGSMASPSDVLAGDRIGSFFFQAEGGGAFRTPASIETYVDSGAGTITSTNVPTNIQFKTAPVGSATRATAMTIGADKSLTVVGNISTAGTVDGLQNVVVTTSLSPAVESPEMLNVLNVNNYVTNNGGITYTLPTAAAGKRRCYRHYTAKTGTITINTSASGQFIDQNGTASASGGYVVSGGALGDSVCFTGVSSTVWLEEDKHGTWTLH